MKIKTRKLNRINQSVRLADGVNVKFDSNLEGELEDESRLEEVMARDSSIYLPGDEDEAPAEKVAEKSTKGDSKKVIALTKELGIANGKVDELTSTLATRTEELATANEKIAELSKETPETEEVPKTEEVIADKSEEIADGKEDPLMDFSTLKMDDIKEVLSSTDFPKEEWEGLKKDELVAYATEKMK